MSDLHLRSPLVTYMSVTRRVSESGNSDVSIVVL